MIIYLCTKKFQSNTPTLSKDIARKPEVLRTGRDGRTGRDRRTYGQRWYYMPHWKWGGGGGGGGGGIKTNKKKQNFLLKYHAANILCTNLKMKLLVQEIECKQPVFG